MSTLLFLDDESYTKEQRSVKNAACFQEKIIHNGERKQ
jgi:hypothetical protein